MSKADAQRAMREAKYAARNSGGGPSSERTAPPRSAARPPARSAVAPTQPKEAAAKQPVAGTTCGHRSINGRECRREAGHAEKSHRYS